MVRFFRALGTVCSGPLLRFSRLCRFSSHHYDRLAIVTRHRRAPAGQPRWCSGGRFLRPAGSPPWTGRAAHGGRPSCSSPGRPMRSETETPCLTQSSYHGARRWVVGWAGVPQPARFSAGASGEHHVSRSLGPRSLLRGSKATPCLGGRRGPLRRPPPQPHPSARSVGPRPAPSAARGLPG